MTIFKKQFFFNFDFRHGITQTFETEPKKIERFSMKTLKFEPNDVNVDFRILFGMYLVLS